MTTDQWIGVGQAIGPLVAVVVAYLMWRLDFRKRYDPFRLELFKRKMEAYAELAELVTLAFDQRTEKPSAKQKDVMAIALGSAMFIDTETFRDLWPDDISSEHAAPGLLGRFTASVREALEKDIQEMVK